MLLYTAPNSDSTAVEDTSRIHPVHFSSSSYDTERLVTRGKLQPRSACSAGNGQVGDCLSVTYIVVFRERCTYRQLHPLSASSSSTFALHLSLRHNCIGHRRSRGDLNRVPTFVYSAIFKHLKREVAGKQHGRLQLVLKRAPHLTDITRKRELTSLGPAT